MPPQWPPRASAFPCFTCLCSPSLPHILSSRLPLETPPHESSLLPPPHPPAGPTAQRGQHDGADGCEAGAVRLKTVSSGRISEASSKSQCKPLEIDAVCTLAWLHLREAEKLEMVPRAVTHELTCVWSPRQHVSGAVYGL